jgi:hypothetical protein
MARSVELAAHCALEGNNSRIRGLSHRARGYRNRANLILAIFHCGGKLSFEG